MPGTHPGLTAFGQSGDLATCSVPRAARRVEHRRRARPGGHEGPRTAAMAILGPAVPEIFDAPFERLAENGCPADRAAASAGRDGLGTMPCTRRFGCRPSHSRRGVADFTPISGDRATAHSHVAQVREGFDVEPMSKRSTFTCRKGTRRDHLRPAVPRRHHRPAREGGSAQRAGRHPPASPDRPDHRGAQPRRLTLTRGRPHPSGTSTSSLKYRP